MLDRTFDFIIVGAGAAGCVLAARLSEMRDACVLLVEAGADAPPGREHPDIREPFPISFGNPSFSWPGLTAEVGVDAGFDQPRKSRFFLQGRGVGGGTNINGSVAFRGQPGDYDGWEALGAEGWQWQDVLPYFRKLETDLDFLASPVHGDVGPIVVRRHARSEWGPFSSAVASALERKGYRYLRDYNAEFEDGFSSLPMTNLPDRRVSASSAYLDATVRGRPNLTILPDAVVDRIEMDGARATGVHVRTAVGMRSVQGREVIVSCGGLFSPALLMRSGIGPADHLQAHGIAVVRDLRGVGRHLMNHPKIEVAVHLPRRSMQRPQQRDIGQNCLRYSSGHRGCDPHDMGLVTINRAAWHPLGQRIGAISIALYQPFSQGHVELAGPGAEQHPKARFNLLDDPRDHARMLAGLRFGLEVLADPAVSPWRNEAFFPKGGIVTSLGRRSTSAWLKAFGMSKVLEVAPLRRVLMNSWIVDPRDALADEGLLKDLVLEHTGLSHHVSCTCKMGAPDDPMAVVNADCRVRGVEGLRVVDASVFPRIMRAGMYLPVMMVAEKMADRIKDQRRHP